MWLCQVLDEWAFGNIKVWDWSFTVSSSLQYVMSSALICFAFYVDACIASVSWSFSFREFYWKISLAVSFVTLIYYFSVAARVEKMDQKNRKIEALYIKIDEERAMIQKLFDMIPAKISWTDSHSKYKMVNQGLVQHLKVQPKSLLGSEFGFTQNPQFKELNHKIQTFIHSQQMENSFEYPVKVGNEIRRHHVILKKINSAEGKELIMMTLDIEDFKKAQDKNQAS